MTSINTVLIILWFMLNWFLFAQYKQGKDEFNKMMTVAYMYFASAVFFFLMGRLVETSRLYFYIPGVVLAIMGASYIDKAKKRKQTIVSSLTVFIAVIFSLVIIIGLVYYVRTYMM